METNLSKNIKFLRLNSGASLEFMAKACGLNSKSSFRAYEIGFEEPPIKSLIAMCKVFDVSLDTLINTKIYNGEISWEESFKAEIMSRIYGIESKLEEILPTFS